MFETQFFSTYFLPGVLILIMLGMGSSLKPENFKEILRKPLGVIVGLFCQMVLLPVFAFIIASIIGLANEYKVGLMLIAACPGGAISNLLSFILKGDVALSIAFTAVNSFLTIITIPIIVNYSVLHFMGAAATISLPFWQTVLQILLITVIPVVLGMVFRAKWESKAIAVQQFLKPIMVILMATAMFAAIFLEKRDGQQIALIELWKVFPWALLLNVLAIFAGWAVAGLLRLGKSAQITVGLEVGLQNSGLAIAVGTSSFMLNNAMTAVPASVYALFSFFTAVLFGIIVNGRELEWRKWISLKQ